MQRPEPIGGVKLAFLPKKTRGESVQLRLTLHYGNAENLKGLNEAAGFLRELMTRETKKLEPPADSGRSRQELRPAGYGGMGGMGRGARGGGGGGLGSVTFSVQTKRANLAAVLEIAPPDSPRADPAGHANSR